MKKLILIIIFFSPLTLLAQKFYIRLGANASNVVIKTDSDNDPVNQYVIRPIFGFAYNASINKTISFRPELLYSEKGLKIRPFAREYPQSNYRLGYIEMPIFLSFSKRSGKNGRFIFDIGPYFALGITGSYKTLTSDFGTDPNTEKGKVIYYNEVNEDNISKIEQDDFVIKRTDFGIKFGFGFEFKDLAINAFYARGLVNTIPNVDMSGYEENGNREYNSTITISFAFLLNEQSLKAN